MSAFEFFLDVMIRYENGQISMQEILNQLPELIATLRKAIESCSVSEIEEISDVLIEERSNFSEKMQVLILSFLTYALKSVKWNRELMNLTRASETLSLENKFYIYNAINNMAFLLPQIMDADLKVHHRLLYHDIYMGFKEKLKLTREIQPLKERNENAVVFFTSQFLTFMHAPTRTILDRAAAMARNGWEVHIINTSERVGDAGKLPFFSPSYITHIDEYENRQEIIYEEQRFSFLQCRKTMPDIIGLRKVIDRIKKINPYCIFMVGGSGLTADLCSNFYPLITINTVFSSIAVTESQFQLIGRPVEVEDREYMKKFGFSENHLQYCRFTFPLVGEEDIKLDREKLGLPQNRFTAIIVGWRLAYEVKKDFIEEVLLPVVENGGFIVFMGNFTSYDILKSNYPLLAENSRLFENIKNVLPYYHNADIYLNPKRAGGGNSVVEAMYSGVVPVSLEYGDVSLSAGKEFCVPDYAAMLDEVLKLQTDSEYYLRRREKAMEHAKWALDSERWFLEAFHGIEKLPEFQ